MPETIANSQVERVAFTCSPDELASLKRLRSEVIRATGLPISVSAIVRAALVTSFEQPLSQVIGQVGRLEIVKTGRRKKST